MASLEVVMTIAVMLPMAGFLFFVGIKIVRSDLSNDRHAGGLAIFVGMTHMNSRANRNH